MIVSEASGERVDVKMGGLGRLLDSAIDVSNIDVLALGAVNVPINATLKNVADRVIGHMESRDPAQRCRTSWLS